MVRRFKKETTNCEQSTTNRKSKGFTLIEILVVLSIMAVLTGGLLYSTNNAREKGKDARRKDDLKTITSALTSYYTDFNHYPPTDPTDGTRSYLSDSSSSWIPDLQPYLNKFPKDPLQAGLLSPLAGIFENGKKIAGGSLAWLTTNQTTTQKPKGQVAGTVTANLGNNSTSTSSDTWGSGNLYGTKFAMGANTGTATTMYVYINSAIIDTTTNNKFELAIYNDNAGKPSTPVANASGQGTVTGAGWNSITFSSPVTLYSNTTYWLLYSKNAPGSTTNAAMYSSTGSTTDSYYFAWTFGSGLPNNPGCCTQTPYNYSIYVPYTYDPAVGTYSDTIRSSTDDGKTKDSTITNEHIIENSIVDNPQGTYYGCTNQELRNNYFRFSNITIPKNATIDSAYLTITPASNGGSPAQNSVAILDFKSELKAEQTNDAGQWPASVSAPYQPSTIFYNRVDVNSASVHWDNIGIWNPLTAGANVSPNLKDIIQPLVRRGDWTGSPTHINIFWLDRGTLPGCTGSAPTTGQGRAGISYDGSAANAPRLTITWTAGGPPSETSTLTAAPTAVDIGGTSNLTWTYTGNGSSCSIDNGIGSVSTAGGTVATPALSSTTTFTLLCGTAPPAQATVTVGSIIITDPPAGSGVCDGKNNAYCVRISDNQKAYVIWAQLENANDPELYLNANAKCTTLDFDQANNPSSPYLGLGIPANSTFNYCMKSPQ